MRFFRRSLIGLFLMAVTVSLLSVAGYSVYSALQDRWAKEGGKRPARERVFSANVIQVNPGEIIPILTSFGEVGSSRSLELRAPVGGAVVYLSDSFKEGGKVTKGDLLARIDPADAQTAVDVARTDLVEAKADLRDAERAADLAKDELAAADEQAKLRVRALERQRDLKARGVGTEAAVETAELEASSATQSVLSRRQAVQTSEARLDQVATLIERREINLRNAERLLADTEIFAAFTGRLSEVNIGAGGLVGPNERLAQLIDPEDLEVSFRVSTAQYARLLDEKAQLTSAPVEVALDVLGTDLVVAGQLTRESAAVQAGTTGRLLFASLEEPGGLRPGDFVTIRIKEPGLSGVARLPSSAVDAKGTVLALGDGDRLEEQPAKVLRRQGDDVIVEVGVLAGREVVAERSQLLGAGIKVNPVRPEAAVSGGETSAEPEFVTLDDTRRAKLIAFVEGNGVIPAEAKARMLMQLNKPEVSAKMVARIEARMGS